MNAASARESHLANPWIWLGIGFLLSLLAASLSLANSGGTPLQAIVVVFGLLLVGIGLTIRLNSYAPPFADQFPALRPFLLVCLTLFQAAGALLVCWSVIAAFVGFDPLMPSRTTLDNPPPLQPGLAIVLWMVIVPMCIAGAAESFKHLLRAEAWTLPLETAVILMFTALACLFSGYALSAGGESVAFFLSVLTAFVSATVSLSLLTLTFRRLMISAALVLHFGAIVNATLAAPPSSWLLGQLWTRFSRPYLEFMYLNNAYHFYSPDPGPATYVWFRIFYDTGDIDPKTKEPILDGRWFKIPDVDEKGNHRYNVALEYQRHLSLTENIIPSDGTPPLYFRGIDGKMTPAPFFAARILNSPDGAILKHEIIGQDKPPFILSVPFHQFIPNDGQFQKPNLSSQRMYETYVRHAARTPHPIQPKWPVHSVKVYRVTHMIAPWNAFVAGMDPQDPEFYRPYYMGQYKSDGKLMNPNEPLLYWLLPILRDNSAMRDSPIRSWAHMHAGDPICVFLPAQKKWVHNEEAGN